MSTESVRTDISPTVDPRNVDPLASAFIIGTNADGVVHDPAFTSTLGSMTTLHEAFGALAEAEKAVKSARDPNTERRLRDGAEKRLTAAAKAAETAFTAIDTRRQQVEEEIVGALGVPIVRTSVTDSQRGADVRSALRSMGKTERISAVRAAINEGDAEAVASVFAASPIASGFSSDEVKLLRMEAERKFAPRLVDTRTALEKLRGVLSRASDVTRDRFAPLVGVGDTRTARAEKALRTLEGGAN